MADTPATPSADYKAMEPYWAMVRTILDGAAAMRAAGETYLPKFPNETADDYAYRRKNAKFTNVYRDIVESLAAKPFSKEVAVVEDSASQAVTDLIEDIDGEGNHLNVFAANLFFQGINDAVDWIFVDKTPVPIGASRATEKQLGARPYWVHIPAARMLAIYSAMIRGKEEFVHARIHEPESVREGFTEVVKNRVRVLDRPLMANGEYGPATWQLFEEQKKPDSQDTEWVSIGQGPISIGIIAVVPFITGRRRGTSWQFVPPMQDAAFLQVEHYQQETNLKSLKEQACFPMLAGNGVTPPVGEDGKVLQVPVGPKSVLFAPPSSDGNHGEWTFIEPAAATLTFLAADVKATEQQLREIGRQPLTAQAGITVVSAAYSSQKASSAVQAWALRLKDALEQALKLTCLWLADSSEPEVSVHTDFAIELESDKAADVLLKMRETKDISREALIVEAKRRDWLSSEYDAEADMENILAEDGGDPTEVDLTAAMLPPTNTPPGNVPPAPGDPAAAA